MPATAMPKTAMNKQRNAFAWEHKVWFAEERRASSPASDRIFAQNRSEFQLGGLVSVRTHAAIT